MKVLMVCLGNICRSPLGQGILQDKASSWDVDSAGTAAYHVGNSPDPRSIDIAKENGIDISHQKARQIRLADLSEYDLILTMDTENYNNVLKLTDSVSERSKVHLILNFLDPALNQVVPDPYYNNNFQEVYDLLDKATDKLVKKYS